MIVRGDAQWLDSIAKSVMLRHSKYMVKWCYEFGLILKALETVYHQTGNPAYVQYIKNQVNRFVDEAGVISGYDPHECNLDHINPGKVLLFLYENTKEEKYRLAAHRLREQLKMQPRNRQGGFWHKGSYPHQMWLDGLYMSSPFYAQYAGMFGEMDAFDDIVNQIVLLYEHTRDPKTGLLYHAWDESRGMKWSDDITGCSPNFWGRAIGWYIMAVIDILDYLPAAHPKRSTVIEILRSVTEALVRVQDPKTGVWYQVLDKAEKKGNYLESSASSMFTYALFKGVRLGYLDKRHLEAANKAYQGILDQFVEIDGDGFVNLRNVCAVAGLGGNPYRDGSLLYYFSEPIVTNDYKGYGPFVLASVEFMRARPAGPQT